MDYAGGPMQSPGSYQREAGGSARERIEGVVVLIWKMEEGATVKGCRWLLEAEQGKK